ncbi:hypothetical protein EVAR_98790_1 [Eumeta japonica]|uniref:PiggyBac transposable element-derived protein domain-containing protein n=1 Tax=Eumeta variegata TaxID=151549 RepID=A0A4C2A4R2_EUMVA|nr:hypothetical protein EVAR_98790_1 [Eumeta japonica]
MDVDHEKLLSGDVNFKWQRDFTAFTAIGLLTKCLHFSDNDKQPLPNAKSKQPLAASNNQLLTKVLNIRDMCHDGQFYNSPALARYLKCRGFDCLGTERLTRKNIPEDVKR